MTYTSSTSMNSDYIRVTAQGSYSYEQMFGFFDYCRKEADNSDLEKVLIDCVELKMQLSEVQRFEGGQMIASLSAATKGSLSFCLLAKSPKWAKLRPTIEVLDC